MNIIQVKNWISILLKRDLTATEREEFIQEIDKFFVHIEKMQKDINLLKNKLNIFVATQQEVTIDKPTGTYEEMVLSKITILKNLIESDYAEKIDDKNDIISIHYDFVKSVENSIKQGHRVTRLQLEELNKIYIIHSQSISQKKY